MSKLVNKAKRAKIKIRTLTILCKFGLQCFELMLHVQILEEES